MTIANGFDAMAQGYSCGILVQSCSSVALRDAVLWCNCNTFLVDLYIVSGDALF